MPPTRGATSKDADIVGINLGQCSAFARSSPYPSHRSLSRRSSLARNAARRRRREKAYRGTTRHGAPRQVHQSKVAAMTST
jgi:hypothetical protein